MLIVAGLQVPVILLFEVNGNSGAVVLLQSGPICVNVAFTFPVTTMSIFDVVAHCPAAGVNVYVTVPGAAVLMVAGFQVPVIPFDDVVGNAGAVWF